MLIQLFERRVLTYVPSFEAQWQVQMGNIGAHYYDWRYNAAGKRTIPVSDITPITVNAGDLGSAENPIKMAFEPSSNSTKIIASGQPLGDLLSQVTGYKFDVSVPTSYAAVIEAMGSSNVDVAWLAPFSYALANQKYGAQVILGTIRKNQVTYPSVFITADTSVKTIADLQGKKFAFVDPASASGYLYPVAALKTAGLVTGTHRTWKPTSAAATLSLQAAMIKSLPPFTTARHRGGAVFGGPLDPATGQPTDARLLIAKDHPDVYQKVRIIYESQQIPNDTVSVRKDLDPAMVTQIQNGLLKLTTMPDAQALMYSLYQIDGLIPTTDSFYDPLRQVAQDAGITNFEALFPTPVPATPKP